MVLDDEEVDERRLVIRERESLDAESLGEMGVDGMDDDDDEK